MYLWKYSKADLFYNNQDANGEYFTGGSKAAKIPYGLRP
jgi:hypothetical protein